MNYSAQFHLKGKKIYKVTFIEKFVLRCSCSVKENQTGFWERQKITWVKMQVRMLEELKAEFPLWVWISDLKTVD